LLLEAFRDRAALLRKTADGNTVMQARDDPAIRRQPVKKWASW